MLLLFCLQDPLKPRMPRQDLVEIDSAATDAGLAPCPTLSNGREADDYRSTARESPVVTVLSISQV